ncbi:MAG: M24 family metallopeptidase [Verrucomicrobia bacterium]|nr:M24 family metallopeptidase [Verrucomicrobiota bacterium]
MNAELSHKLAQVRALLKARKAQAALLGLQPNFSWLAGGNEAHIPLNSERSFGQLLVTPKKFYAFANRIEMRRQQEEVLCGLGAEPLLYEWHDAPGAAQLLRDVADPRKIVSDCGDFGTDAQPQLFAELRYSLLPVEVKRYRALGRATEAALNETCRALKPGQTEFSIAGQMADACWQRNLTPIVLLVATDERILRYRHPLPTTKKLQRYAMLVLCARQHGLIVALTRLVHFGKLPGSLRELHKAVCAVDVAFHQNTRVGTPVREVFRRGVLAYAEQGFPDEWHLHHQGGPCGYQGRDYLGSPTAPGVVQENQPFAWNPSITGAKSEDTILATAKGPQVITAAQDWPMMEISWNGNTILRPDILVR